MPDIGIEIVNGIGLAAFGAAQLDEAEADLAQCRQVRRQALQDAASQALLDGITRPAPVAGPCVLTVPGEVSHQRMRPLLYYPSEITKRSRPRNWTRRALTANRTIPVPLRFPQAA